MAASERLSRYPLYTDDPDALGRMRDWLKRTIDWHDMAPINGNSLARLLDTIEHLRGQLSETPPIKRFHDGTPKPFLSPERYAELRDDDRFLYNEGPKP